MSVSKTSLGALAVSAWLGFSYGAGTLSSPVGSFKTSVLGGDLGLAASFNPALGPGRLRILAGPTLSLSSVSANITRSSASDTGLGLGLVARVGYLFALHEHHGFGIELGYQARPYAVLALPAADHIFSLSLGYLFA